MYYVLRLILINHLTDDFGFENNKGYGTKFHLNALKKHHPSPLHRLTFKPMKNK